MKPAHIPVELDRKRLWLAALPLSTGAGLLVYVVTGVSLPLGVGLAALLSLVVAWVVWQKVPVVARSRLRRRAFIGAAAGILATMTYDLCRYVLVTVLHFTFWPFDIFTVFGRLLIGDDRPAAVATVVGSLYHYTNGVCFGVAFVLVFRKPGVLTGLAWAAGLELLMVSVYPGWLGLKAMDEFLSVSIFGHAVYGTTLGIVAHSGFRTEAQPAALPEPRASQVRR